MKKITKTSTAVSARKRRSKEAFMPPMNMTNIGNWTRRRLSYLTTILPQSSWQPLFPLTQLDGNQDGDWESKDSVREDQLPEEPEHTKVYGT